MHEPCQDTYKWLKELAAMPGRPRPPATRRRRRRPSDSSGSSSPIAMLDPVPPPRSSLGACAFLTATVSAVVSFGIGAYVAGAIVGLRDARQRRRTATAAPCEAAVVAPAPATALLRSAKPAFLQTMQQPRRVRTALSPDVAGSRDGAATALSSEWTRSPWSGRAGDDFFGGSFAVGSLALGFLAALRHKQRPRRQLRRRQSAARVVLAAASEDSRRVVVTGLGVVSTHGLDKDDFYEDLCAGKSSVKTITKFDPTGLSTTIAAQIDDIDVSGYVDAKSARRMDDVVKYTIVSGKKALEDAGLAPSSEAFKALQPERCGVMIGSAMGGTSLQTSIENMEKLLQGKKLSPFFVPYTLVNVPGGLLAIDLDFQGPNYAVVTACATGNYCIASAAGHIQRGECDVMLAGGAEAAVTRAGIGGFVACKALSSRNDDPERASRPWDKARDGFVMGEGAGVLCLESLEHARRRGAEIYAEYLGGAFTCDAHHMTEPHPEGAGVARCIRMALDAAGVSAEEVGYLNCHGTSTPAGDMAEVRAIQKAFDGRTENLVVNSTKSMLGHCLGAAAGVEAVATVQALRHGKVHPTINLQNPEDGFSLFTPREVMELPDLEVAASNSFGFGGHNSCVVFRKFTE
eukprot:TRINITY_DN3658_c0_g2_i1.p1 TRINITY_DN3658_c0_g2~~TRINITY_DN3658_c0_g2_i1.p1  ORF type:complete len:631 (-),score=133.01 TRINITY_DN3658_c0_g2_i1:31-1923(-)